MILLLLANSDKIVNEIESHILLALFSRAIVYKISLLWKILQVLSRLK